MERQIDIRVSEASDVEARVEVVYTGERSVDAVLVGTISGPRRETSRTLPAEVRLQSFRRDSNPAAEAVLPDPCYWSPDLPFLYDFSLELRRGDEVLDSAEFTVALHPNRGVPQ